MSPSPLPFTVCPDCQADVADKWMGKQPPVLIFLDDLYSCEGRNTYFDVLSYVCDRKRT